MTKIHHIPLDQIARDGLRQSIELWALRTPQPPLRYGLISGYRRLAALTENGAKTIPAFLRDVASLPDAMANMVAENEIRAQISPWDRARTINDAVTEGICDTHDAAIATLHPVLSGAKRRRLRTTAQVVEVFDGLFPDPHALSERKLLRLAGVLRADLEALVFHAAAHHRPRTTQAVWELITPIMAEAEAVLANPAPIIRRPGRPRRIMSPTKGLSIRRELRPDGWTLIFTGERATDSLVEDAMDEIERMYGEG